MSKSRKNQLQVLDRRRQFLEKRIESKDGIATAWDKQESKALAWAIQELSRLFGIDLEPRHDRHIIDSPVGAVSLPDPASDGCGIDPRD